MQKVPDHTVLRHGALSACKRTVSGSLSFPFRGSFHLSLTVLVHYRSMGSIQAWRMVPPDSRRIARVLRYSGTSYALSRFVYRAVTVSGPPFQAVRLTIENARSLALQPPSYRYVGFGLIPVRSPLLGESLFVFCSTGY